jgi:hypothetical protein
MSEPGSERLLIELSGADYWAGVSLTAAAEVKEGRIAYGTVGGVPPTHHPASRPFGGEERWGKESHHPRCSVKRYNEKPG